MLLGNVFLKQKQNESCEIQRNLLMFVRVAGGRLYTAKYFPRYIGTSAMWRYLRCAPVRIVYRVYDRLRRGVTRVKRKSTYLATGDLAEHAPDQQKLNFIAVTLHLGKK